MGINKFQANFSATKSKELFRVITMKWWRDQTLAWITLYHAFWSEERSDTCLHFVPHALDKKERDHTLASVSALWWGICFSTVVSKGFDNNKKIKEVVEPKSSNPPNVTFVICCPILQQNSKQVAVILSGSVCIKIFHKVQYSQNLSNRSSMTLLIQFD